LGDTDNTSGVGLGLALSRGLTEVMGGTLDPEETPGGGLTMIISLLAAPGDKAAVAPGQRERDATADGAARPVTRHGPGTATGRGATTDGAATDGTATDGTAGDRAAGEGTS